MNVNSYAITIKTLHKVCFILLFLSIGCKSNSFNLEISGNPEAIDAYVYIDGKNVGKMEKLTDDINTYYRHHFKQDRRRGYLLKRIAKNA